MRDDAEQDAGAADLPEQVLHGRVGAGDVMVHVFAPERFLLFHLLLIQSDDLLEKGQDAGGEIVGEILFQRDVRASAELFHERQEGRIVHRRGGIHHRIVMVQDQAFVIHRHLRRKRAARSRPESFICWLRAV